MFKIQGSCITVCCCLVKLFWLLLLVVAVVLDLFLCSASVLLNYFRLLATNNRKTPKASRGKGERRRSWTTREPGSRYKSRNKHFKPRQHIPHWTPLDKLSCTRMCARQVQRSSSDGSRLEYRKSGNNHNVYVFFVGRLQAETREERRRSWMKSYHLRICNSWPHSNSFSDRRQTTIKVMKGQSKLKWKWEADTTEIRYFYVKFQMVFFNRHWNSMHILTWLFRISGSI